MELKIYYYGLLLFIIFIGLIEFNRFLYLIYLY